MKKSLNSTDKASTTDVTIRSTQNALGEIEMRRQTQLTVLSYALSVRGICQAVYIQHLARLAILQRTMQELAKRRR